MRRFVAEGNEDGAADVAASHATCATPPAPFGEAVAAAKLPPAPWAVHMTPQGPFVFVMIVVSTHQCCSFSLVILVATARTGSSHRRSTLFVTIKIVYHNSSRM